METVFQLLSKHDTAFVAVSHPNLPETIRPTTDFLYIRFHGKGKNTYRYNYSEGELADWVSRLTPFLRERELFAFFNNDFNAYAPKNAETFRDLLGQARNRMKRN
jgi:uncharacterized protein YecE (DUF72 family)